MNKSKDRYQEPRHQEPRHQIILDITGLPKRHVIFLQLIAEYDLSCVSVQEDIIKALNNKHAIPLEIKIPQREYPAEDGLQLKSNQKALK